jgi:L-malate glycosyltransferase
VRQRLPIPIAIILNETDEDDVRQQARELVSRIDERLFTVHVQSIHSWREIPRLARWCRERDVQIMHACDFRGNVFGLPAAALARVPVRIGSRRDVAMTGFTPGQQRLQRLAYQLAHRVIASSDAAAQRLVEEGVPDWKVATIANGVDLERFVARGAVARRRVITTVGSLKPGKGHDVLLKAAARIVRRVPDAQFQIVGDGERRSELERQAASLRISAQVKFLGPRGDVPELLRQSDLFVYPSFLDGASSPLLEAMAAGLPIVASRAGGVPEAIEHERSGILVPPGDDRALAAGIVRLIERPGVATRLAAAARHGAQGRYAVDRMVTDYQQLFFDELAARVAPEALTWAASSGN